MTTLATPMDEAVSIVNLARRNHVSVLKLKKYLREELGLSDVESKSVLPPMMAQIVITRVKAGA